jgi:uptake hydrogenase large subunit
VSPEGEITVRLSCVDQHVIKASVASSRTGLPARLVRGRPAGDVERMVPLLFSVCGRAQGAAAASAIAAANGVQARPDVAARQALEVTLETVQDTVWRLLIDWPKAMGEAALVAPVALIRQAAGRVKDDGLTLDAFIAVADAVLADHVYGQPPATWLASTDLTELTWWINCGQTLPARLLRRLRDEAPELGHSEVALMPDATLDNLRRAVFPGLETDPDYARFPRWNGAPAETGALARQAAAPLIDDLKRRDGRIATTRFVARLVELAALLDQLRLRAAGRLRPVRAHALAPGIGVGLAETARGLLLHRVSLEQGLVVDYQIVAPTEWNFHPDGALTQGLKGRSAADAARLEREARTVVQSLDPCVACKVEIADA